MNTKKKTKKFYDALYEEYGRRYVNEHILKDILVKVINFIFDINCNPIIKFDASSSKIYSRQLKIISPDLFLNFFTIPESVSIEIGLTDRSWETLYYQFNVENITSDNVYEAILKSIELNDRIRCHLILSGVPVV